MYLPYLWKEKKIKTLLIFLQVSFIEELKDFFESLPQEQFGKIRKFFESMPRLRHETKVKNPKTGVESKITFSGLQDFFGLASPTTA